ncbi:MAG: hypothetical protein JNL62_03805 [Bryobacterales bacterium]|nr:hypothetical protein [Bryobacterales bacterium]
MNFDPEGPETGEPIEMLAGQEHEASAEFLDRVRSKIHRRAATSQVASFSWYLPRAVLLEMAELLGHVAQSLNGRKEPRS